MQRHRMGLREFQVLVTLVMHYATNEERRKAAPMIAQLDLDMGRTQVPAPPEYDTCFHMWTTNKQRIEVYSRTNPVKIQIVCYDEPDPNAPTTPI